MWGQHGLAYKNWDIACVSRQTSTGEDDMGLALPLEGSYLPSTQIDALQLASAKPMTARQKLGNINDLNHPMGGVLV